MFQWRIPALVGVRGYVKGLWWKVFIYEDLVTIVLIGNYRCTVSFLDHIPFLWFEQGDLCIGIWFSVLIIKLVSFSLLALVLLQFLIWSKFFWGFSGLILLKMVAEYINISDALPALATEIVHRVAEILKLFNSRSCQLVLGAGAMQVRSYPW